MTDFRGVAFPVKDSSNRRPVELELLRVFVVMRAPDHQWLGSWPATELRAAHVGGPRFRVSLRRAEAFVDVENPQQFLDALENAVASMEEQSFRGKFSAPSSRSLRTAELSGGSESDSNFALIGEQHPIDSRHVASTLVTPAGLEKAGVVTPGLDVEVEEYKLDVVEWLQAGMAAWFDFYFRLGPQDLRERLAQAAGGLEKSALQLHAVSDQLKELEVDDREYELVAVYADGVGTWASALDQIAVACRLDQRNRAADGFTKLNKGTAMVEELVAQLPEVHLSRAASLALSHLDAIEPEANVSTKSIARAKEPWRRALLSACWARDKSRLGVSLSSATHKFRGNSSI